MINETRRRVVFTKYPLIFEESTMDPFNSTPKMAASQEAADTAPRPLLSVSVKRASPTERISRIQRYLNPPEANSEPLSDWENWGDWGNFGNFYDFASEP
jgi:hypothetical protein